MLPHLEYETQFCTPQNMKDKGKSIYIHIYILAIKSVEQL